MKTFFLYLTQFSICLFFMIQLNAQQNNTDITGVYFLTGVMETACAFELKKDSSFEFLFSQGALDRGGKGKWTLKDGHIVLNSTDPRPPKDYAFVSSKTVPGDFTTIKMVDKNTMILSYSDVTIKTSGGVLQESTDSQGEIIFPKKEATEISLLFRLCPGRESVFTVNSKHNYFEFRLEPWIAEVFFRDFSLQIDGAALNGANPILEGKKFTYVKDKQP
ncbi:MAG: hypothetical protein ABJB86_02395 [Bacteroidota bacterium]